MEGGGKESKVEVEVEEEEEEGEGEKKAEKRGSVESEEDRL